MTAVAALLVPAAGATAQEISGLASFYAGLVRGALSAAHPRLPFGTFVRVTRLDTGKRVIVRIDDRGPFIKGRIIDVSRRAADALEMVDAGVVRVRIEVVDDGRDEQGCRGCTAVAAASD